MPSTSCLLHFAIADPLEEESTLSEVEGTSIGNLTREPQQYHLAERATNSTFTALLGP